MKKILVLWVCVLFAHTTFGQVKLDSTDFDNYIERIIGRFSTQLHQSIDSTKGDVLVRTVVYGEHDDALLLYTQQGEYFEGKFYPYRQRIYAIYQKDDYYIGLDIFALPNEEKYWDVLTEVSDGDETFAADLERLRKIPIDSLIYKDGCSISIYKDNLNAFRGSTNFDDCKGSFKGATYTTTEFVVYPHEVISWERGWDDNKNQKWGPVNGPYIYSKISKH
jgi:hypothetical protein